MPQPTRSAARSYLGCLAALLMTGLPAGASGIYQDGMTARSRALGGTNTAGATFALDALTSNPAGLASLTGTRAELGLHAGWVDAEFRNSAHDRVGLDDFGVVPHAALSHTMGPFALALGVIPEATLRANWRYRDLPGGLDGQTSYGFRTHKSELQVHRLALGASYAMTPQLALGASLGLVYNRNRLEAPYIIQSEPRLRMAKVLFDMETEGWGWTGQFGLLWKPVETVQVGLSYTLPTRIHSEGRAFADGSEQLDQIGLGAIDPDATFDAEVINTFPQKLSGGVAWRALPKLMLLGQVDWINWEGSFDTLEVRLRHVDNPDYKALLAKSNLDDDVPLNWRDQWVLRVGAEYELTDHWTLRAGYRFARNPVPPSTLSPVTAVIAEHVASVGLGYRTGRTTVDLAWQWNLPQEESIGRSDLLSGEYSNSEVRVSTHWLALTTSVEF